MPSIAFILMTVIPLAFSRNYRCVNESKCRAGNKSTIKEKNFKQKKGSNHFVLLEFISTKARKKGQGEKKQTTNKERVTSILKASIRIF